MKKILMNIMRYNCSALLIIAMVPNTKAQSLTHNEVQHIVSQVPTLITANYVDKKKGTEIVLAFKEIMDTEKYLLITDADTLASILTKDLREISQDGHLYVQYISNQKNSHNNSDWKKKELENERIFNFGFTEIKIVDGNIGYLKIVEFMHPRRSMQTAIAAMKFVENTDALVIDLRGNGGGYPDIMEYILNHYFEGEPKLLSTTQWSDSTLAPMTVYSSELIYSKPRVGTPLYVLIDKRTASAAEYFAYTLQAFKNATIIGERSAGAANMNTYFPLSSNFRISISTGTPINAITNSNWELKGVQPDVKAKAADAECVSYQLFRNKK